MRGKNERQGSEKEVRVFASPTKSTKRLLEVVRFREGGESVCVTHEVCKAICRGRVITQKCERGRCNSISQKESSGFKHVGREWNYVQVRCRSDER